ncbi:SDR family NAD(P)-dependent oxidoreductase [Deinococcus xianganensis]|uniref:SDR family NAD(P)-dependent oxidoreductase n=1 Tax=Deinococcus xianganensis TaxID=1507289 RepID=A0A6I4YID4_9DEIO|nr:SDR family oxidoreductase [Deinococcus xianganensis]MXV19474.1 SDR family NAD(P)-dependent oxidoreductase [Deinococcus xianganensis]
MSDDLTPQDWLTAQRVLRAVLRDPALADEHAEFRTLVAGVNRLGRKHARQATISAAPAASDEPRVRCYMCRQPFAPGESGSALCSTCAALNDRKRALSADLRGRVALLTGGRVRIGYATSLRLLRCGARVIVTTRFPQDAARRYAQELDAAEWADRLTLHGLDLRDVRAAQQFADELLRTLPHLDVLINNAAQTVAKPGAALRALLAAERQALPGTGPGRDWVARPAPAHLLTQPFEANPDFPDLLDEHGDPLDLRVQNSWTARLDDVPLRELLEVQLVNVTAPGLLSSALLPLLRRSPFPRRFIVNVSSVEGQFARAGRSDRHPHTNMAKAALNMLTRTSGPALARQGIFMTSVDPGWVSHQEPHGQRQRMAADGFRFPLTLEDAAARLCDPVLTGVTDPARPPAGVFLKDYRVQPW